MGLLAFVGVYLGLTGYLGWVVWRTLGHALWTGQSVGLAVLVSLPACFFLAFLLRGLFVVRHEQPRDLVEVTPDSEPELFAFLHRLADETRAPRPHKVFLSPRVNAAVFYDLSFWNLLLPSRKNLEIGLGLVNALSLDELKAVVAHEYGHFAQRTMAVGRWVYVARQVAGHVVGARGIFDAILQFLSNIDLRVAWIGWILRLFVWAIRAVLDTMLRLVILAQRALGREMELQADRVAVSVSGSDSLIHALHRLGPADEAWAAACSFASDEWRAGRAVDDVFALQSAVTGHLRRVLDDDTHGCTPSRPIESPGAHRIFETELAQPPRMWLTHPPNREREDSAKEHYVLSPLDPRSAWTLFRDPAARRRQVTAQLLSLFGMGADGKAANGKAANGKAANGKAATPPQASVPLATSLALLEERWSRAALEPRFRGAYLGRDIAAHHTSAADMIGPEARTPPAREEVLAAIDACYPETLRAELARYREQRDEVAQLEGLRDGVLSAPGGVIRHRGREIARRELSSVLADARRERREIEMSLLAHDARCRRAHIDAAARLGGGWDRYLESLAGLLHYATHAWRELADAHRSVHHALRVVLADGNVSRSERQAVVAIAAELHEGMRRLWHEHGVVSLPPGVQARHDEHEGYTVLAGPLKLGAPDEQNLGDWLQVMDGWALGAIGDMRVLAEATLDTLLECESSVAKQLRDGIDPGAAPDPARIPKHYRVRVVGDEREPRLALGLWDRFQTADGVLAGTARFLAASALLLPALVLGARVGAATIVVYNGLPNGVLVRVDGVERSVYPGSFVRLEHGIGPVHVEAATTSGQTIESFDVEVESGFGTYVYDVAQAAALMEWTATYGQASVIPERALGAPRWMEARQDVLFTDPPEQIDVGRGGSGATRTVLTALRQGSPESLLPLVTDPAERDAFARAHLRYEPEGSPFVDAWFRVAPQDPGWLAILRERATSARAPVIAQRAWMDLAPVAEREAFCVSITARADDTEEGDALYLALRCREDDADRDAAFEDAFAAHPDNPWLAYANVRARGARAEWAGVLAATDVVRASSSTTSIHDDAGLEALRAERALHLDEPTALWRPSPEPESDAGFLLSFERPPSREDPPWSTCLHALGEGALDRAEEALEAVTVDASMRAELEVFLGASDGASETQIRRALAVDARSLSVPALVSGLALAVREQQDPARFARALDAVRPTFGTELLRTLSVDRASLPTHPGLLALATRESSVTRGMVFTAASIVLGRDAPPRWRDEARALLFVPERPHLGRFDAPVPQSPP
jgi:Zn-dependent protease with chaperone function